MRSPRRSAVFGRSSLIGQARLYEQHLRETDQWVDYGFYLEFVLPTLGRLAENRADSLPMPYPDLAPRRLTPALVESAVTLAGARGDEATARGAWKDFLRFIGYVPAGIHIPPDSL